MIKIKHTLHTAGDGYWSDAARGVTVTKLALPYVNDEEDFGELRVYFDTATWDCNEYGLIYTDSQFLAELRAALMATGFSAAAAGDVEYSEQGMQGDNYVSCDVGEAFIKEWLLVKEPLYKMVKEHKKVVDKTRA